MGPPVRFGHWALVAAFAVAYLSAEQEAGSPAPLHVWGSYVAGAIVVLRVVWGFLDPRYARFSDFVRSPTEALAYFIDLLCRRTRRTQPGRRRNGHCTPGLPHRNRCHGPHCIWRRKGNGPLAVVMVTDANANGNQGAHRALAARRGGETESTMGELHGLMANITVALVVAHIFEVAIASFVHKENLFLAMITGRKRRARN